MMLLDILPTLRMYEHADQAFVSWPAWARTERRGPTLTAGDRLLALVLPHPADAVCGEYIWAFCQTRGPR